MQAPLHLHSLDVAGSFVSPADWAPRLNLVRSDSDLLKVSLLDETWEQFTPCGHQPDDVASLVIYLRRNGYISWWNPAGDGCGHLSYERIRGQLAGNILSWRAEEPELYQSLAEVMRRLAANQESLELGEPLDIGGTTDLSLRTALGLLPLSVANPSVQRPVALAWLLTHLWFGHQSLCTATTRDFPGRIVVLCDEVEEFSTHPVAIHSALMFLGKGLGQIQIIATASRRRLARQARESWNAAADRLFELGKVEGNLSLSEVLLMNYSLWAGPPLPGDPVRDAIEKARSFALSRRRWNRPTRSSRSHAG